MAVDGDASESDGASSSSSTIACNAVVQASPEIAWRGLLTWHRLIAFALRMFGLIVAYFESLPVRESAGRPHLIESKQTPFLSFMCRLHRLSSHGGISSFMLMSNPPLLGAMSTALERRSAESTSKANQHTTKQHTKKGKHTYNQHTRTHNGFNRLKAHG